jgi:hypothetical protein
MHESLPQRTLRQSFFGFFRRVLITSACRLSKQKRPYPQAAALLHLLCQIFFCFHCHPFPASVSINAWRDEPEHNNPDFPAMQV